jgi:hypothetical protein
LFLSGVVDPKRCRRRGLSKNMYKIFGNQDGGEKQQVKSRVMKKKGFEKGNLWKDEE